MKVCVRCNILKPDSEYHKESRSRDGLQSYCKECASQYGRRRRAEGHIKDGRTKAEKTEYMRQWRAKNHDHYLEYHREYRQRRKSRVICAKDGS